MTSLLRWTARIHKWLALVVGIQIVLWVAGGVVMTVLDIDRVHGDHIVGPPPPVALDVENFIPVGQAVEAAGLEGELETLQIIPWLGRPVFQIMDREGVSQLVDARTGEKLTPITSEIAIALAEESHLGDMRASSIEYMETQNIEYRGGPVPAWRINFDDEYGASFYVSENSGMLITRRNNEWRVFDFFWMLHVMGYWDRDDFNTWWLIGFALFSFVTVFAGMILLIIKMRQSLLRALKQSERRES